MGLPFCLSAFPFAADVRLAFLHRRSSDSASVFRLLLGASHLLLQLGNLGIQLVHDIPLRRHLVEQSRLCILGRLHPGTVADPVRLLRLLQGNVVGNLTTRKLDLYVEWRSSSLRSS